LKKELKYLYQWIGIPGTKDQGSYTY
jgi:hypothetical protein